MPACKKCADNGDLGKTCPHYPATNGRVRLCRDGYSHGPCECCVPPHCVCGGEWNPDAWDGGECCMDCGTRCDESFMCDCCVDLEAHRKTWDQFHDERRAGDE
jgi:hypothetical protein